MFSASTVLDACADDAAADVFIVCLKMTNIRLFIINIIRQTNLFIIL